MGSRLVKQLWILLVKNFRMKINTLLYTSFEIIGPVIYAVMVFNILGSRQEISRDAPTSIDFDEYSSYKHGYILGYAPANEISDELMFRAARLANQKYNTDLEAIGFDSEYHMVDYVRKHPEGIRSVYAFDNMTSRTTQLPETLHLILRPIIDFEGRNKIPTAFKYDFHAMQAIMESYIYQHTGREHKLNVTWSKTSKLPTMYESIPELIHTLTVLYCLLLGFLICRNVYCMAHERESGVLKLLSQTGVNMYMYWLSWFITVFAIVWLASLVIGAMMFVKYNNISPILIKSDICAVLLYFTLFAVACTFYCIMGSVICHKANTASTISTCFFLGSSFAFKIMENNEVADFLSSFFFNKNVHLTLKNIDHMEKTGRGYTFSETEFLLVPYVTVSICGLLYAVIAIFLYTCVINGRPLWKIPPEWKYKELSKLFRDSYQTMVMSEDNLSHLKSGVIIDKLCANIPAPLGEINFTIYQNLVTVITDLDGNSSTTFLSILTGENQPLKGSVKVRDLDIVKNIAEVKQLTSLCPKEQTALFDSFTVLENLQFFHKIKSACQGHHEESRLQEVIDMFELNRHLRTSVDSLSSAEKRLLQIAIVYLGKSKMLLFDCPTLDMDPYTKSKSWNVIRRNTQDTIVIVCTESIEEAEMVGDMIAVVSGGLIRSYGTIEYIYLMYGIGYKLVIDKTDNFDYDRVEMVVTEMINNVKIVDDTTTRLVFLLPMEAASIFYHLLTFLENHKHTLGIVRFSVNTVSLEEAILEKSTEVALLELNEKQSAEFTISTPKRYEMQCTALREPQASPPKTDAEKVPTESNVDRPQASPSKTDAEKVPTESNVDRPQASPSKTDAEKVPTESNVDRPQASPSKTDAEKGPTKSDVRRNSAEELQVIKYTGSRLTLSQIEALFKKKIILSVCSFHLEIVQVIFLVALATCLCTRPIDFDHKEQNRNPRNLFYTSVRVASVDGNNTASSHLVQRYMDLFLHSNVTSVKELSSDKLLHYMNTEDDLENPFMIGASFHVDNISNVYESVALHSTGGEAPEDWFLPESITAVMNAFLHYFNQSNRYYMYASMLSERHSKQNFNYIKSFIQSLRVHRHHSSFLQSMAFLLVPYFAVSERTTGFKHLQHLSGVGSVMYWAVSLVSDLTTYLFLVLLYPVIAEVFETKETIEFVESIELMIVASGVVMLLYIYVLQFAFSVPASAAFIICLLNYFLADAATIVYVLFGKEGQLFPDSLYDRICLALPPCIFPYYIFMTARKNRYYKLCQINSAYCHDMDPMIAEHCCKFRCVDPQCTETKFTLVDQDTGIDSEISIALAVHLVFWTTMLLLIEYRIIHKIRPTADCCAQMVLKVCRRTVTPRKSITGRNTFNIQSLFNRHKAIYRVPSQTIGVDSGITEELNKLQETTDDVGLMRIVGVDNTDSYIPGLTSLNFLISNGESYCFVDTDKSRASNILKILSGMKAPASGKIIVKGKPFKIAGNPSFPPIGYCTEMNAVLGALTGREVLTIHAKLRGIPDENLSNVVDSALKKFNILDKADNRSGNYNSSDKRLLNIAVAVIGDPEIILLDDPFGNLDVVNKSLVWQALDKCMLLGSTVIMCSDKIREVSDNVTVLAILLDGEPVCVGSPEIVRDRYCCSYTLLAKLDVSSRNLPIESLISTMQERFPKSVIFYDHQDFLHMRIPYDDATLPDVFALMESAKKHLQIQSYKLVHTNLSYVITAIQQRVVEESTPMNERDDDDEEDSKT